MAKKLNEKGKVLEDRHLIDLAVDTGKNGDEIDELLTITVSRNELKMLCGILQGIGDGESWMRLCLNIWLEYLNDKDNTWKKINLFSITYNEDFFGESVTMRVPRSDLFYPIYFWSLQQLSQKRLTTKMTNECLDMFQKVGWQEAISHLERELGHDSSEVFDLILKLNENSSSTNLSATNIGS